MQDHQSYEQYIQDLIKKHELTLNEVRGEVGLSQESLTTASKIDDAIKQSQKIVQESLKLLEESQTLSQYSSVQQITSPLFQDLEAKNKIQKQSNLKLDYRLSSYEEANKIQQISRREEQLQAELVQQKEKLPHDKIKFLEKENEKLLYSNSIINDEKKRLQEQVQAFEKRTYEMKMQIDQKQDSLAEQLSFKDNKIKELENEIIQSIKMKEQMYIELEQKNSEILSLKNQINSNQNFQSINNFKNKIDELEQQFTFQSENYAKEIQMYQKSNKELKEKLVQAYEMGIKQRDIIRHLTNKSFDKENLKFDKNYTNDPLLNQDIQETPESIQMKIRHIQNEKQKDEEQLLNIRTVLPVSPKDKVTFEQFEQQLKENELKIQQLEQRLSQQKQYLDQSQVSANFEKETDQLFISPKVRDSSRRKLKGKKSNGGRKLLMQKAQKTPRAQKYVQQKEQLNIQKFKRSNSLPRYSKNRSLK